MIEEYHFGSIKIDGETYNHDVQIGLDNEVKLWWREESHRIEKRDIEEVLGQNPEVIVIGTGEMGVAKVAEELQKEIKVKGIELIIEPTSEAVQTFNSLKKDKKVVGLFHLTC
jgi:hypothetical protein